MRRALEVAFVLVLVGAGLAWWVTGGREPSATVSEGGLPGVAHGAVTAVVPLPALVAEGFVTGGAAGGIAVRDGRGVVVQAWTAHAGPVRRVWLHEGDVFSVGADGSVARWRMDGTRVDRWRLADHALNDAAMGADGAIVAGGDRGVVARLDGAGWVARGAHGRATFAVALSPDGREVLTGGADGRIVRWRVADGVVIAERVVSAGWVTAVHWDAARRVVGASDGAVMVWVGDDEAAARVVMVPGGAVVALAVDGAQALVGSEDGRARLVNLDAGTVGATLDPSGGAGARPGELPGEPRGDRLDELPAGPISAVVLAADRALIGGRDDRLRAWRVTDGQHLDTLPAVTEPTVTEPTVTEPTVSEPAVPTPRASTP